MLCPLCGEPSEKRIRKYRRFQTVACPVCGNFNISNVASIVIRQQSYKLNFEALQKAAREIIKNSKKVICIDSDMIYKFKKV